MSKRTKNWVRGGSSYSWWKNHGRWREEVHGACIVREDGVFYLRKKMRSPFGFGTKVDYEWGHFYPPIFESDGVLNDEGNAITYDGSFVKTSNAAKENWDNCWANPQSVPEQTDPEQLPPVVVENEWNSTQLVESIDWRLFGAGAIIALLILFAVIKRKKG